MTPLQVGSIIRAVRIRRRLRQADVARLARVSTSTISRIERGHLGRLSWSTIERVAAALEIRLDLVARWRGGDLDRLVNSRHAGLHESVARAFARRPAWQARPEVSFSIYGERGVVDVLAWHAQRRALLVIELKTAIVDVNDLMGTLDRKRRLGRTIAAAQGWDAAEVSAWVVLIESRTNRRAIADHRAVIRAAFPADGRQMRRWLAAPSGPIAALSYWVVGEGSRRGGPTRRVKATD